MENEVVAKIPPNDQEAEQAVLGAMLTDKDAAVTVIEILKKDDFYRNDHAEIFDAMIELYTQGHPIDIVTVKGVLESRKMLEIIGGMEYLTTLASSDFTTANVETYAQMVEGKSILRKLIQVSNQIVKNILQKKNTKTSVHIKDVLIDAFARLEQLYNNKDSITGVPTGFIELDKKTAGLQPANLIFIAARPAMGKSALALNIAANAAIRAKVPVAIFSLEMSKEELTNRILCSEAMVDSGKIRNGSIEDDDWLKLANALGPVSEAPIYIDDTPGITIMELRAKCRKMKIENDLGLVVIDYLQLMQGTKTENRQQEISEISRSLKILAKELNIPVIALAQLSRAPEMRADHRPILSDLRESGSIEQDADIVAFIYRDDYYNEDTERKNVSEIIIAKQRSGSTGTVELGWIGDYTKFVNLDKTR